MGHNFNHQHLSPLVWQIVGFYLYAIPSQNLGPPGPHSGGGLNPPPPPNWTALLLLLFITYIPPEMFWEGVRALIRMLT